MKKEQRAPESFSSFLLCVLCDRGGAIFFAPKLGYTHGTAGSISGLIVRELGGRVSNWRSQSPLAEWLAEQGCIGIAELDTRALTRRLRDGGTLKGVLTTETEPSDAELLAQVRAWSGLDGIDLVQTVSCPNPVGSIPLDETTINGAAL